MSVFARPTKAMPGKTTWNFFLGIGHRLLDPTMGPQEFAVTATYESRGRRFAETLHVDLEFFRGTGTVSTTDESEKALKALAKSASEISAQLKLNGQSRTHCTFNQFLAEIKRGIYGCLFSFLGSIQGTACRRLPV